MKERYAGLEGYGSHEPIGEFLYRRGVDPVHIYIESTSANHCFACCETGWWIVGETAENDKNWTDLGPYDSFEIAAVTFKVLGL